MKNSDLIKALQQYPDDMEVTIFDHKKNLMDDCGDGSSEGVYSNFEVGLLNDDLSEDELAFHKERTDEDLKVFIVLSFDNPDIEIPE
jgi:hypothetical protein